MQQVDLPSHSLVQQYKRWGHLISHRISEMTHIVLFSTVAINKHERRDGARGGGLIWFSLWRPFMLRLFMCITYFDQCLNKERAVVSYWHMWQDDRTWGGGNLRESLLQPPPCGADDFSEGTEGLAQKVLWGTEERGLAEWQNQETVQVQGRLSPAGKQHEYNLLIP